MRYAIVGTLLLAAGAAWGDPALNAMNKGLAAQYRAQAFCTEQGETPECWAERRKGKAAYERGMAEALEAVSAPMDNSLSMGPPGPKVFPTPVVADVVVDVVGD